MLSRSLAPERTVTPPRKPSLSHLDSSGRPGMVGVAAKAVTHRVARACAEVVLPPEVAAVLAGGEWHGPKGPVLQTAILAGTMAAKRTSDLIPLCHPLAIEGCRITVEQEDRLLRFICEVEIHHKTGVEMEALTGATVAALTLYDMCKALSHDMEIRSVRLLAKSGGRRKVGG